MRQLNTTLPSESQLTASAINPAAIYYGGDAVPVQVLDARPDDARSGNDLNKNVLVGGSGKDTLIGGKGDDTVIGGAGDDTYIWNTGDGNDTIVDTQGSNRIIINGTSYNFAGGTMIKQAGTNIWKDPTGKVMLTHNSPWRMELSDGSVIQLGEGFDPTNWHLNLVAPDAPGVAADATKVFLTQPVFTTGEQPAYATNSGTYTDLNNVAHWVYATQLGEQVITLGDGDDYVDVSRAYAGVPGEALYQSFGADQDRVYAGAGNDTIFTGFGSDYIEAGAGNDTIYSGARGQGATGIIPINSAEDAGNSDHIMAGDGDDRVWGSGGADIEFGEAGIDEIWGRGGSDLLYGGEGDDVLYGDAGYSLDPFIGENSIFALLGYSSGGDDRLVGGAGNDRLIGGVGQDNLEGGAGDDQLWGDTDGNQDTGNHLWIPGEFHNKDTLDGGDGANLLMGGAGDDTYVIHNQEVFAQVASTGRLLMQTIIDDTEGQSTVRRGMNCHAHKATKRPENYQNNSYLFKFHKGYRPIFLTRQSATCTIGRHGAGVALGNILSPRRHAHDVLTRGNNT